MFGRELSLLGVVLRHQGNGSDRDDATLEVLLSQSTAFSDARAIVFMALSEAVSKGRVVKNLVMLNHAKEPVRRGIGVRLQERMSCALTFILIGRQLISSRQ
jgi:hypothetical protein